MEGKLQGIIDKWGVKSALLILALVVYIYQNDRAMILNDINMNKAAIAELKEGKASRKELQSAIETISRNNDSLKQDIKEMVVTLRDDLIGRIDLIGKNNK